MARKISRVEAAARRYGQKEIVAIPLKRRSKEPVNVGWQHSDNARSASKDFAKNSNIGILLGEPSKWLVDVDLDCPEAVILAESYLPRTESVFGRPSKARSHYLFVSQDLAPRKFGDPSDGTTLLELRSTGQQSMFPPSTHPSGELVSWSSTGTPPRIEKKLLETAAATLAAATLLLRHYDHVSSRDELIAALIGMLARNHRWTGDAIHKFVDPVMLAASDEEVAARRKKIARTIRTIGQVDARIYGIPKLIELLGNKVVDRLLEWLPPSVPAESTAPAISLRSALAIGTDDSRPSFIHPGYLENEVLAVLVGKYGSLKTFLAMDWALSAAAGISWPHCEPLNRRHTVVYICAEGRSLMRRMRAWCGFHFPDRDIADLLAELPFWGIERPVNLSDTDTVMNFVNAIDGLPQRPSLIIVDTLSRNSVDVEESNSNMSRFLGTLDRELRARYQSSVLLVHHPGWQNEKRSRGPSALVANTDAYFLLERDGSIATLTVERLKDSEPPPPVQLRTEVVDTSLSDDAGNPLTSLALVATVGASSPRPAVRGTNQRKALDALRAAISDKHPRGITEEQVNSIIRRAVEDRRRVKEVFRGLQKTGAIKCRGDTWSVS